MEAKGEFKVWVRYRTGLAVKIRVPQESNVSDLTKAIKRGLSDELTGIGLSHIYLLAPTDPANWCYVAYSADFPPCKRLFIVLAIYL